MRKKKPKAKKDNAERWLLTYSDLMNLLMILFILLFAMGSTNEQKFELMAASLSGALGSGDGVLEKAIDTTNVIDIGVSGEIIASESTTESTPGTGIDGDGADTSTQTGNEGTTTGDGVEGSIVTQDAMQNLQEQVDTALMEDIVDSNISTTVKDTGLVITFNEEISFDSGDDQLRTDMKASLSELAILLNRIDNKVVVEGYTDNVPINTERFSSNWQLSSSRAANVVEFLQKFGSVSPTRLSSIGYADNNPAYTNDTIEGRAKNRRIEIKIMY